MEHCQDNYMAPLYDPKKKASITQQCAFDQFEFPNVPCEYPWVWVQADEAQRICQSVGKRLAMCRSGKMAVQGQSDPSMSFRQRRCPLKRPTPSATKH